MIKLDNISMKPKLIALFLALGLIPMAIVAWLAMDQGEEGLKKEAFSHMESVLEIKRHAIENFFKKQKDNMATLVETVRVLRVEAAQRLETVTHDKKRQDPARERETHANCDKICPGNAGPTEIEVHPLQPAITEIKETQPYIYIYTK